MKIKNIQWLLLLLTAAVIAATIWITWSKLNTQDKNVSLGSGNGRIEAVEINVASMTAGRIAEILVDEGDYVTAGQVLARMETTVLEARKKEAEALLRQDRNGIKIAQSQLAQRLSEKEAAVAVVGQRQAEMESAQKRLARTQALAQKKTVSMQQVDDDRANYLGAQAMLYSAEAGVKAAEAAIATAKSQVIGAESQVEAARASVERISADLDDTLLRAPRSGRIQYRVAQPGEVISAGGHVLNMIDLADVYMTFFLPTAEAGRVAIGAEARIILDAAPQYVLPAQISYVADVAQFTPKTVETAIERQKLMFRIKARISPELLKQHIQHVKTGLPGTAYVRLDPKITWPKHLQLNLPR